MEGRLGYTEDVFNKAKQWKLQPMLTLQCQKLKSIHAPSGKAGHSPQRSNNTPLTNPGETEYILKKPENSKKFVLQKLKSQDNSEILSYKFNKGIQIIKKSSRNSGTEKCIWCSNWRIHRHNNKWIKLQKKIRLRRRMTRIHRSSGKVKNKNNEASTGFKQPQRKSSIIGRRR